MVPYGRTPRPESTEPATGDGRGPAVSNRGIDDASGANLTGTPVADVAIDESKGLRYLRTHRIATWNVRGMSQGKLDIIKREMDRLKIGLLGISELHWTDNGYFQSDDFTVYYSGHDNIKRNGVAFIACKRVTRAIESYSTISDRIISIRIRAKPLFITILQIYAPTSDASEDEIERFYSSLEEALQQVPKKDIIYIMGDFNAKVGCQEEERIAGKFGLGDRNDAGDRLVQFCQENRFKIANTWFTQHKRRLYTWTSPNGLYRNQIDYVLCSQRWCSSVLAVKTYPGADCGSDHELLVAKIKVKLCNIKKTAPPKKFDVSKIPPSYAVDVKNRFELLDTSEKQPDELWQHFQSIILETATKNIPHRKREKKCKWLTDGTINLADQRRTAKAAGKREETVRLNAEFQRAARQDKDAYWNRQCEILEEEFMKGHTRSAFTQVKKIRTSFAARKGTIKDKEGRELRDQHSIKSRWREYTEELYAGNNNVLQEAQGEAVELEPSILSEEVVSALKQLPNNKAPGIDGIPAEMLRSIPTAALTTLCQKIWETSAWPREWKRSVFIPLPKAGDAKDCSNYRTIALIPHASKVLLKIIQQRLSPIIERELPDVQAGFRRGRGTRNHIANLRWIMEKSREYQKDIYMCFIDYKKAFDCVEHGKLWAALQKLGVPDHLTHLIRSLYKDQEATVRTAYGDTDWLEIGKGVRQGCILSPFLFNLYAEIIMRKIDLEDSEIGVKIGGRNINNLRYADDTTLLSETEDGLRHLIKRTKDESAKFGLLLNIKKTKIMTTAGNGNIKIKIDNEEIECVQDFIFLGSRIVRNGDCSTEVKRRLTMGRSAMLSMNKVWKSKYVSLTTKCRLVYAIVFPITMYGCESWILKKADRRKVDSFELWCWRRLLRIPWTARVTNREVLERINPDMSLEGKITRLRLTYIGHVMRSSTLEKDLMLGMVSGKRRPGRQRMRWLDTIKADTGLNLQQLTVLVQDRIAWRELAHRIAKSRIRLNGKHHHHHH
ncbi:endonuclease-reverse transcriptase-like protein [Dinothrombium tinctorium]|uniref:Endonuclease-reverse transcriptase-like protein n=1 Tax=Dinothrombium tinctorium TaxID=1965070 RepID=A0A3S3P648_9ACAR|nr:endonuclease-reverse transcriptase-like protein [Dinothrombium tinctorium]